MASIAPVHVAGEAAANEATAFGSRELSSRWPLLLSDASMREVLHNANSSSSDTSELSGEFSELSFMQLLELQEEMLQNWTKHHTIDDPDFDLLRRPAWRGLVMTLFITVILIGMIGNSIVVFVVVKNRNMQNVTNIFIANLALSDIGLCLFSLPVQLYYQLTDHWIFGEILCKIIFAAFAVPMYVSTLTILLIAFDRYWLILYPLRNRMSTNTALILIAVIIVTSLLFSIPVIWFTSLHLLNQPDLRIYRNYCLELWPSEVGRKAYSVLMFLLQFCLPLCMTAILYYKIYCRLKNRPTNRTNSSANTDRKQKTNKILFAIVSLFVICWLPWNVFSLLTEIDHDIVKGAHFKFVDLLLKVFAMSSACINPFLYCWLNDNFRKELDQIAIKMKLYRSDRRASSQQASNIQPMLNGHGASTQQLPRAVTMDIITADVSTSRMSITRMSTTRFSTCSALDLPLESRRNSRGTTCSIDTATSMVSAPPSSPGTGQRNNSLSTQKYGNLLTVPL